jgi:hypothetical protein
LPHYTSLRLASIGMPHKQMNLQGYQMEKTLSQHQDSLYSTAPVLDMAI